MAVCATSPSHAVGTPTGEIHVARWAFGRADETLICELGLDRAESVYELTIHAPWEKGPSVERFSDVHAAVQRQASLERALLDEGWSLDRFETTTNKR